MRHQASAQQRDQYNRGDANAQRDRGIQRRLFARGAAGYNARDLGHLGFEPLALGLRFGGAFRLRLSWSFLRLGLIGHAKPACHSATNARRRLMPALGTERSITHITNILGIRQRRGQWT
jgi:hypothetical protein